MATFPAFLIAVFVILATPGPDMLFMIATGLNAGRRKAVVAAFGVTTAVSIYVIGSALGIAAVVERTPIVLDLVRFAGAAYLLYLAGTTWQEARGPLTQFGPPGSPVAVGSGGGDLNQGLSYWDVFRRGFIVNITNPKMLLFIAAFIPQFVDPAHGHTTRQFLLFAVSFQLIGLLVDLGLAVGAGSAKALLVTRPNLESSLNRVAAVVYLLIALWLVAETLVRGD